MDSHKLSAFSRLEVVETGRRRRFSEAEKLKIVMESMAAPRLVSTIAQRHAISRSLLLTWRRAFQADASRSSFVPAVIVPEPPPPPPQITPPPARADQGRIEIVLACGPRVIVDATFDPEALARVLQVLERR
jgi:transposase